MTWAFGGDGVLVTIFASGSESMPSVGGAAELEFGAAELLLGVPGTRKVFLQPLHFALWPAQSGRALYRMPQFGQENFSCFAIIL